MTQQNSPDLLYDLSSTVGHVYEQTSTTKLLCFSYLNPQKKRGHLKRPSTSLLRFQANHGLSTGISLLFQEELFNFAIVSGKRVCRQSNCEHTERHSIVKSCHHQKQLHLTPQSQKSWGRLHESSLTICLQLSSTHVIVILNKNKSN